MYVKESKWTPYFWNLSWLVGLIIIAIINLNIVNHFKQIANDTFNPIPLLWLNSFVLIIFGIYISLIFVKRWSLKFNPVLFWGIFIPSLLISFLTPVLTTISSIFNNSTLLSFNSYWLIKISTLDVFGIVAGLTLILSIFNTQSQDKNY